MTYTTDPHASHPVYADTGFCIECNTTAYAAVQATVVTREQHDALEYAAWKNRNEGSVSHYLMPDGTWQIVLSQDEDAFKAANPGAEFGSSVHVPSD